MGCGDSHGPGGVLGLEATAELCIFGVGSIGMRARGSTQKALTSVEAGQPWWQSSGKLGSSTTLGAGLSALRRFGNPSPLVQNGRGEWGTGIWECIIPVPV